LIEIGKKGEWLFQALSSLPLSRLPHQLPPLPANEGKKYFRGKDLRKEEERQRGRQSFV